MRVLESPLDLAQPSRLRRLPESNRCLAPQGDVGASDPLRLSGGTEGRNRVDGGSVRRQRVSGPSLATAADGLGENVPSAALCLSPGEANLWFEEWPQDHAELLVPPEAEDPHGQRPRTQPLTDALNERLEQAISETADEARLAADETAEEPV